LCHESGGEGVAACELFYPGFVEVVFFVDLTAEDHAGAGEAGDFGFVGDVGFGHEEPGGGGGGVAAEDFGAGFEEDAFAVAAGAECEGQDVGTDGADG